jgi:hypothetical protein
MKRFTPLLILLLLAGAFAFWWFSPAQMVKRRTASLLDTLTLETGTGGRRLAVYSLNALLADEVELDVPAIPEANGTFARADLESAFTWLCGQAKQTRFEPLGFLSVTADGDRAAVEVSLDAMVELPGRRPLDGRYSVTFHWCHGDDGWRLCRATWQGGGD